MSAHLNVNHHLDEALKQCLKSTGNLLLKKETCSGVKSFNFNLSSGTQASTDFSTFSKHSRIDAPRKEEEEEAAAELEEDASIDTSKAAPEELKSSNTVNSEETKSPAPQKTTSNKILLKNTIIASLVTALLAASGIAAKNTYEHFTSFQETEDAYVTGHLHQISSRVSGTVEKVLVEDNEHVQAGQPLVLLDPKDFQIKIDAAKAELKQAEEQVRVAGSTVVMADVTEKGQNSNAQGSVAESLAGISSAEAAVDQTKSAINAASGDMKAKEAELDRAKSDLTRYETLLEQGAVSTQQRDFALRDFKVAQENYNVSKDQLKQAITGLARAQQAVRSAKAQLVQSQAQVQIAKASSVQTVINKNQQSVALAAVEKAKAALAEAEQNLQYTVIPAPTSGRVGNKTVEAGQRLNPGQALMSIVSDKPWVVANFKETQLNKMRIGQPVEIKIDSFPEHEFEGTIESFAPASGASFAIIKSDNATGNFTKIVQRIPVKIMISPESARGYEDRIVPGMSVVATVQVKSQSAENNTRVAHSGH